MDLTPCRFATWEDLRLYCYQVAGTVGLMVLGTVAASLVWRSAMASSGIAILNGVMVI